MRATSTPSAASFTRRLLMTMITRTRTRTKSLQSWILLGMSLTRMKMKKTKKTKKTKKMTTKIMTRTMTTMMMMAMIIRTLPPPCFRPSLL